MKNYEKEAVVVVFLILSFFSFVLFQHNRELKKQHIDIVAMKDYISSQEISRITMDKELQIQKDNTETIMKWNEIQAKRINKLYNKMRRTKLVADASLELGLKNKNAIGWDNLCKKQKPKKEVTKRFLNEWDSEMEILLDDNVK